jgi:hypothetical protein
MIVETMHKTFEDNKRKFQKQVELARQNQKKRPGEKEPDEAERESIDRINVTRQSLKHAFLDCQNILEQQRGFDISLSGSTVVAIHQLQD